MLDLVLGWIRSRVKAAALAGLADALGSIDGDATDPHALAAGQLAARLSLAAPDPEEGPTKKRK